MGLFDDMFGGIFDFNGDGETDFMEEMIGFHIIDEMEKERRRNEEYEDDEYEDEDEEYDDL